jgi:hypothetical protein
MIDRCDLVVVLLSEEGVESEELREEVRRAYDRWALAKRKNPVIITVRVNCFDKVEGFSAIAMPCRNRGDRRGGQ